MWPKPTLLSAILLAASVLAFVVVAFNWTPTNWTIHLEALGLACFAAAFIPPLWVSRP